MKKSKQLFSMIAVLAMVFIVGATAYAAGDVVLSEEATQEGERLSGRRGAKGHGQKGTELFDAAIEAGIITQSDVEAIETHREANRPDLEAVKEATEGMTREEVQAYIEETYGPKPEGFEGLVEDGILTQEQADALTELAPERAEGHKGIDGEKGHGQKGTELFDAAIEAGVITESDVEAIEAHREANRPDMEAVKEATEGMTREEVRAYMEETYGPKPEGFEGLVEDGVLTQEQADALLELAPERPEQGEMPQGDRGVDKGQGGPRGDRGNVNGAPAEGKGSL